MLPKIVHPTFDVTIPSSKKKMKIRPMLVKEEKVLLMAKTSKDVGDTLAAIKQVVSNCMVDQVDVDEWPIFDVEYVFLRIRAFSINNIAKPSFQDTEDGKVREFDVDLDKVEVKFPEQTPSNTVKINDDISLTLRWPKSKMYDDNSLLIDGADVTETVAMYCIDKVYDKNVVTDPSMEKKEDFAAFLESLSIETYEAIRVWIQQIPTLYYKIAYTNEKDHERIIELTSLNDFFSLRS